MVDIGSRIKAFRTAQKLTQETLAKRLGVAKSTVSSYENGSRLPSYDILVKLARIFHTTTDSLLCCERPGMIDATGLTERQLGTVQEVIVAYQRYNALCARVAAEEPRLLHILEELGLPEEDNTASEK